MTSSGGSSSRRRRAPKRPSAIAAPTAVEVVTSVGASAKPPNGDRVGRPAAVRTAATGPQAPWRSPPLPAPPEPPVGPTAPSGVPEPESEIGPVGPAPPAPPVPPPPFVEPGVTTPMSPPNRTSGGADVGSGVPEASLGDGVGTEPGSPPGADVGVGVGAVGPVVG